MSEATYSEIIKLELRAMELESRFRHYHVRSDEPDICLTCGLDLRDTIHARVDQQIGYTFR